MSEKPDNQDDFSKHFDPYRMSRINTVYPGHPCIVAMQIMANFRTYADADARTKDGWSAALSCRNVHGAGGAIYTALNLVEEIEADPDNPQKVFDLGYQRWIEARRSDFNEKTQEGNAAAEAIRSEFIFMVRSWLARRKSTGTT